jgi:hypothetical protein
MTDDNIIEICRREAQAWIDAGIGDGWPLTQAADFIEAQEAEIERLRSGMDQLSEALGHLVSAGLRLEDELSEKRALVDQLQVEVEESDQLMRRSAYLLNGVANALHSGPLENGLWSWHDLPERAAAERALADQLADALSDCMRGEDHPAYTAWEQARRG